MKKTKLQIHRVDGDSLEVSFGSHNACIRLKRLDPSDLTGICFHEELRLQESKQ